jgi:dTDP-4-amino-4,6-dideoxygalactose transaminase
MTDKNYVPFHRPSIGQEESEAVQRVLSSGWLTTGPVTLEFEKQFAAYVGCKFALAVNSGTSALQLALDCIGLRPGDEVLVPSYTFTATAEVVTYFGARPVLCDSVPGGFNIDPIDAERRTTDRTRAIIPVHLAGEPCEMDKLHEFAHRRNLHVIEDAAHALPTLYRGKMIGTVSELTAFSLYATKTITTGEGGILTTNDEKYAERAALMRLHGIGKDAWNRYSSEGSWYYEVTEAGYKLNLCDILSALGSAQLKKCDAFWKRRCEVAEQYREGLMGVEELEMPPVADSHSTHAWHLFILRLRSESLSIDRKQMIDELKRMGIGTSVHFIPLHRHPYYRKNFACVPEDFPNAENAYARCLSLPVYPDLKYEEVERVIGAVKQIVSHNRKRRLVSV